MTEQEIKLEILRISEKLYTAGIIQHENFYTFIDSLYRFVTQYMPPTNEGG